MSSDDPNTPSQMRKKLVASKQLWAEEGRLRSGPISSTWSGRSPAHAMLAAEALLATHWEDLPLTLEHGAPVRLVVPHLYFWKRAKWLRRLTFSAEDRPGFWAVRGDHDRGNPWAEQRHG